MKLTISETKDVFQALDDYASLFCDEPDIHAQLSKLRDRFKLSLIKKLNHEKRKTLKLLYDLEEPE